ncbi:MAG: hypothetical protein ABIH99_05800, partial [Candidatus Micrarchaeota archaeon]
MKNYGLNVVLSLVLVCFFLFGCVQPLMKRGIEKACSKPEFADLCKEGVLDENCTSSDMDNDYGVGGVTVGTPLVDIEDDLGELVKAGEFGVFTDACTSNIELKEYSCEVDSQGARKVVVEIVKCDGSCINGTCKKSTNVEEEPKEGPETELTCISSDADNSLYVAGTTEGKTSSTGMSIVGDNGVSVPAGGWGEFSDKCNA